MQIVVFLDVRMAAAFQQLEIVQITDIYANFITHLAKIFARCHLPFSYLFSTIFKCKWIHQRGAYETRLFLEETHENIKSPSFIFSYFIFLSQPQICHEKEEEEKWKGKYGRRWRVASRMVRRSSHDFFCLSEWSRKLLPVTSSANLPERWNIHGKIFSENIFWR